MAKVGAAGGLKAFGAKLGTATVGLGALALVAAAVNLALTSEKAKDKAPRLSAERRAMEERLGRPVSDVGFALRGMPEEMLRGMGLGFIADAAGLKDHTVARALVAADTAAAVTGPPLITAAAGAPATAPIVGPQLAPLVTAATGAPATAAVGVTVQPAPQGAAGRRARRQQNEPAPLITAAVGSAVAEGATVAVLPAPLVTAAAGSAAAEGATVAAQPAPLVTLAAGAAGTEGATVAAQPAPLITAAAGAAGTQGATVTALPAPLITAAAGAATEGATVTSAGVAPTVDTTTAPGYGPQPGLQVPAVPQIGQPGQSDGEQVPLLRAAVMELRKLNRSAEDKPQGAAGRRARRQQNEPAPHVLDFDATIGALDSL